MRPFLPLLVALALAAAPAAASAADAAESPAPRIYRWVDANGVAHYTTDEEQIPASLRRRFGLPTQPLERAPLEAGAPDAGAPPPAPAPRSAPQSSGGDAAFDAWISQERGAAPSRASEPGSGEAQLPAVSASASDADRLAQVELRIAELSAAIAADEDALSAWIGDPQGGDPVALGQTPQFREIASRLPKRIQELEALRRERDALESATP